MHATLKQVRHLVTGRLGLYERTCAIVKIFMLLCETTSHGVVTHSPTSVHNGSYEHLKSKSKRLVSCILVALPQTFHQVSEASKASGTSDIKYSASGTTQCPSN